MISKGQIQFFFIGFALVSLLLCPQLIFAENLGLGIVLGTPTGISAMYKWNDQKSLASAVAWDLSKESSLSFHVDYLLNKKNHVKINPIQMDFYYGIGFRIFDYKRDSETRFGLRVPVGLLHRFDGTHFEAFGEIGPTMDVIPTTSVGLLFGIGARYLF